MVLFPIYDIVVMMVAREEMPVQFAGESGGSRFLVAMNQYLRGWVHKYKEN